MIFIENLLNNLLLKLKKKKKNDKIYISDIISDISLR